MIILLCGFGSWFMAATISHAAYLSNSASIKAFCQAAQRDLQPKGVPATPQKLWEFSQNIGQQLGWQMINHNVLEQTHFSRFSFRYKHTDAGEIIINVMMTGKIIRILHITVSTQQRPQSFTAMSGNCNVLETRQITYDDNGTPIAILIMPTGRPMITPALPRPDQERAEDHLIIGHIDSGIDYQRADFASFLIYQDKANFKGRDFWDNDLLPYDTDTSRNPFFPQSHGSHVLDILKQTGANFRLLPVRYPRPDMNLMGAAIHWLAANGAQLVMMPLGSHSRDDWTAFFEAARQHPEILFIFSAGNNGLDLANTAIYPAVNDLPHALTITSTFADGRLPAESNFGQFVDIGVPAEAMNATGIDYEQKQVSGSSFAVPKLAGFALCLASAGPTTIAGNGARWAGAVKSALVSSPLDITGYDVFLSDTQLRQICQLP
jgi:hypothetical protein